MGLRWRSDVNYQANQEAAARYSTPVHNRIYSFGFWVFVLQYFLQSSTYQACRRHPQHVVRGTYLRHAAALAGPNQEVCVPNSGKVRDLEIDLDVQDSNLPGECSVCAKRLPTNYLINNAAELLRTSSIGAPSHHMWETTSFFRSLVIELLEGANTWLNKNLQRHWARTNYSRHSCKRQDLVLYGLQVDIWLKCGNEDREQHAFWRYLWSAEMGVVQSSLIPGCLIE